MRRLRESAGLPGARRAIWGLPRAGLSTPAVWRGAAAPAPSPRSRRADVAREVRQSDFARTQARRGTEHAVVLRVVAEKNAGGGGRCAAPCPNRRRLRTRRSVSQPLKLDYRIASPVRLLFVAHEPTSRSVPRSSESAFLRTQFILSFRGSARPGHLSARSWGGFSPREWRRRRSDRQRRRVDPDIFGHPGVNVTAAGERCHDPVAQGRARGPPVVCPPWRRNESRASREPWWRRRRVTAALRAAFLFAGVWHRWSG
jgi:hypothetical protein